VARMGECFKILPTQSMIDTLLIFQCYGFGYGLGILLSKDI
jgi:hypothetical protein